MAGKQAKAPSVAPTGRIAALVLVVNVFVWIMVGVSLSSSYDLYRSRAAVSSSNIARLMAESVAADLYRIDLGLQMVGDEYARLRSLGPVKAASLQPFLARLAERLPMVEAVRIADASGVLIVHSDRTENLPVSVADRKYFAELREQPSSGMLIGRAVQGRINDHWILPFARRLSGPQGFDGVVVAAVTVDWFVDKFSRMEVGPHGAVALRGDRSRGFEQLARYPTTVGFVGQTAVSESLHRMFSENPESGTYEAYSGPDKVHRTHSYQRLDAYPLIAIVGLAHEDWLDEWEHEVIKLVSLALLFGLTSVVGARMLARAWVARLEAQNRLQFLAYHDVLTGLPNRALFHDRFDQARTRADRKKARVALLFVDLDHFKTINDTLGHQLGDRLLVEVGRRLGLCVREGDTISRQGGDEFLLLLPDLPDPAATAAPLVAVMNRIAEPFNIEGAELTTTVSIGIAIYPDDGADFETLAKKADMAMYRAKEAGRNAYRFFDEQMNVEAIEHLTIRNGLRRALQRNEFVLHYQPQIDLATGSVVGAEALIRWNHPDMGLVSPGRFIGVAEESRLIIPIGEWVLQEACRQAEAWRRSGLPALTMAVNLSGVQFRRGDVEQTVRLALETSGYDPACLELEITESTLIQNIDEVLDSVRRLKNLGVRLSIDDFGTGYSSLAYLRRFDVDKLKVDQSFIRDLADGANDAAIVRAIIQMGHSLNLRVIAEGVETAEMLSRLGALGCDEVQGYYFAKPMPAEEFARYLARQREACAAEVSGADAGV